MNRQYTIEAHAANPTDAQDLELRVLVHEAMRDLRAKVRARKIGTKALVFTDARVAKYEETETE